MRSVLGVFSLVDYIRCDSGKSLEECVQEALELLVDGRERYGAVVEGLMLKRLDGKYELSLSRTKNGLKFKPFAGKLGDTFDLVVIGYQVGRGRRAGKFGSLLVACYDSVNNLFVEVSEVGTGFKDEDLDNIMKLLSPLVVKAKPYNVLANSTDVVWVDPRIVVEIEAEDIQKSPRYRLGYALRFPRFKRLRPDKEPVNSTRCVEIEELYKKLYALGGRNGNTRV